MSEIHLDPTKKHDFAYLFDCTMGNPNGDPDDEAAPRMDLETNVGIVSAVAIKRRVRDYVEHAAKYETDENLLERFGIFMSHGVLNEKIRAAHEASGLPTGKTVTRSLTDASVASELSLLDSSDALPPGFSVSVEDGTLTYTGEIPLSELRDILNQLENEPRISRKARRTLDGAATAAGRPEKNLANSQTAGEYIRQHYYDVRMFGAVMTTGLNAGQIRGPMQIVNAQSVHPVTPMEMTITRSSVTREEDRDKERTMGRKTVIPYGLYKAVGFYNPPDAKASGIEAKDLELFWGSLESMWEIDRSASRGLMSTQKLVIFTHDHPLGNAPAHRLFSRLSVIQKPAVETPRSYTDFDVSVDQSNLPSGVSVTIF